MAARGFWATFEGYGSDDLVSGRLMRVLEDWCPAFSGPYLYYPSRRQLPPPLRAFVDFVQSRRRWSAKADADAETASQA